MKIYIPNMSKQTVGGGFTFIRNLKKGMPDCQFVNSWQESDVIFIVGITMTDKGEIHAAKAAGKKILLRVDNVPKKSRNRRQTPHERLQEFAKLADAVVYQSQWAMDYCKILCGNGTIIYNGVDTDIFYPPKTKPENDRYLFAYHGKSEMKCFWQAHYHFQMAFRENRDAEFWFINDFGRDLEELKNAKFDFWNGEKYRYLNKAETPEQMADIMRQCTHLIFSSFADASPQTLIEALSCGCKPIGINPVGGSIEVVKRWEDSILPTIHDMGKEYKELLDKIVE